MVENNDASNILNGKYDPIKDFRMDAEGYFLIRINDTKDKLEIALIKNVQTKEIALQINGKSPQEIIHSLKNYITENDLKILPEHLMYVGNELQKAYIAMKKNIEYIQDDELKF